MFPEGTRQVKGLRKKFEHRPRTGSARIALTARVPLVPAAIKGTDRLARLAELKVAFGEPIPVDDLDGAAAARSEPDGDRPADGADLRAPRSAVSAAARDRRRLARPPRLPRAAEDDHPRRRPPGRGARRLCQLPAPPLGHGGAASDPRRLGHARRADLPERGLCGLPGRAACSTTRSSSSSTLLPELVEAFGFAAAKAAGYEADDFLAAAAVAAEEARGGTTLVATSDRDAFQLVGERTTILQPVKGVFELARIGPPEVRERYGVDPPQVPDFIALRGDPSDRIPGARGRRPEDGGGDPRRARHAGRRARGGTIRRTAGGVAALPSNSDARRLRSSPLPSRPIAHMGGGVAPLQPWGLDNLAERLAGRA